VQAFTNTNADESRTGADAPATTKQKAFVASLAEQAGADVDAGGMTRGDASKVIDQLKPQASAKQVGCFVLGGRRLLTWECGTAQRAGGGQYAAQRLASPAFF
jgi:hypothetical protein